MLEFPEVPYWWSKGSKFMKLLKGFKKPDVVIGYDTETIKGEPLTQQFVTKWDSLCQFTDRDKILDQFIDYLEKYRGYLIVYCFNAQFDLALLMRKYIQEFLNDDFLVKYRGWEIKVFCSRNWYASFSRQGTLVRFLDIRNYFKGSLDVVTKSFGLKERKIEKPEGLGYVRFTKKDKSFIAYALRDAELCLSIGNHILDMHSFFDIPISTSAANFAEKVFRRNFMQDSWKIQFPPFSARRLAELTYHGGKNGYYLDRPTLVHNCHEYDFNAAYGYAMYSLPSFIKGKFKQISHYEKGYVGVYEVRGTIKPCKYGVLYDTRFNYFRFPSKEKVRAFVTSFELEEALNSNEFVMKECRGWIWVPATEDNPIRDYAAHFWEMKNKTSKGDVKYLFYKLLLNSLYGKWIQRNPRGPIYAKLTKQQQLEFWKHKDVSGGLYHPFIGTLITGMTRARLHREEHRLKAIECSTDSVKTQTYIKEYKQEYFGRMQLEHFFCKDCDKKVDKFKGYFIRNRLNLLICNKGHILKATLHGFWGKPPQLLDLWNRKKTIYSVERMPLIREALRQSGKELFEMMQEERVLNIDWSERREMK